jgi:hypothetical protein
MKGDFWNSRGLEDLAKHNYISDMAKEQHLDFIAIMGTDRSDFSDSLLRHIGGGLTTFGMSCLQGEDQVV